VCPHVSFMTNSDGFAGISTVTPTILTKYGYDVLFAPTSLEVKGKSKTQRLPD